MPGHIIPCNKIHTFCIVGERELPFINRSNSLLESCIRVVGFREYFQIVVGIQMESLQQPHEFGKTDFPCL